MARDEICEQRSMISNGTYVEYTICYPAPKYKTGNAITELSIIFKDSDKFEITFNGTMYETMYESEKLFDSSKFPNCHVNPFIIEHIQSLLEKIIPDVLSVAVRFSKDANTFLKFKTNERNLEILLPLKQDGEDISGEDISVIETLGNTFLPDFSRITGYEGDVIETNLAFIREDIERAVGKKRSILIDEEMERELEERLNNPPDW